MKICGRCGVEKTTQSFALRSSSKDGLQSWCRSCNTVTRTEWARANRDRTQQHTRYHRYRLREEQYQAFIEEQNGCCAICKETFDGTPHIDHDHSCCAYKTPTCGKCVRGLLCSRCNIFVGFIEKGNHFERIKEYLGL